MKVIAEGVETEEQLTSLQSMHCDYVQGFLFAKPVNNIQAEALLGKSRSFPASSSSDR
jgi:EAL domain-containing protein (putative c-di-GMP-specific phosphodiesterase class I)